MPVLRTSASDFTAWSRANAVLPANGKAAKSTDTTVDRKAASVVAIGSMSAIGASPSSAIAKRWRIIPAVIAPIQTLTNAGYWDAYIAKYNSAGVVQWFARQGGGGSSELATSVTVDSSGNIIVAGIYASSPMTIYNANGSAFATTLANSGSNDAYIAKYNSAGDVQWVAKQGGSTGTDERANAVTVDSSGNIIVAGYYGANPLTIYNRDGTAFATTLTNSLGDKPYIAKYNSDGFVQWVAKQGGGGTSDQALAVTVDSSGNIIVAGIYTSSTLTIYNKDGTAFATTLTNSGGYDAYIAKYNSAGFVQWVARQGGSTSTDERPNGITVDSTGNIIVAGYFASTTLTIYNKDGTAFATTLANSGSNDAYIAKYNSDGFVQWVAKQSGGGNDQALAVTVDSSGNIIVAGYFNSTPFTIYNKDGTAFATTLTNIANDAYIAKYNSAGDVQWVAKQGGSTDNDRAYAVSVDSTGNIIVAGYFASTTLTIYNKDGTAFATTLANSGSNDAYIAKYNSDGFVQWVAKQGGESSDDQAYAVTVDSSGNIIVAGYFASTTLTIYNSDGTNKVPDTPSSLVYYR